MPSRKIKSVTGYGYVVYAELPQMIEGVMLTHIEALGLPNKQEESVKSLVRQGIWNTWHADGVPIYLTPETHCELRKKLEQERVLSEKENRPISAI